MTGGQHERERERVTVFSHKVDLAAFLVDILSHRASQKRVWHGTHVLTTGGSEGITDANFDLTRASDSVQHWVLNSCAMRGALGWCLRGPTDAALNCKHVSLAGDC